MNRFLSLMVATAALGLTACSGNNVVDSVSLSASTNHHVQVTLSANLNTNNITLNPLSLQFFNPKAPTQLFGQIDVSTPSATLTKVDFTYDFTQALRFANITETNTLPNGTPIPVTGPNEKWLVLQPKEAGKSLVYLNINTAIDKASIGYVLASDQVNSGALGNLMVKFNLTGIPGSGAAGIYNGNGPGTSGFALFADISALFGKGLNGEMALIDTTPNEVKLQIQRFMYELNQRKQQLNFSETLR